MRKTCSLSQFGKASVLLETRSFGLRRPTVIGLDELNDLQELCFLQWGNKRLEVTLLSMKFVLSLSPGVGIA